MKKILTQTTITAPEGFMIDQKKLKENKIEFIPIVKTLPKSWEDLKDVTGYFLTEECILKHTGRCRAEQTNKNVFPQEKHAKAAIALAQLLQLRDAYNDGWVPDYRDNNTKYSIHVYVDKLNAINNVGSHNVMHFKTPELRNTFLKEPEIRKLLEIAKPLL